jgi:hypothetical protein
MAAKFCSDVTREKTMGIISAARLAIPAARIVPPGRCTQHRGHRAADQTQGRDLVLVERERAVGEPPLCRQIQYLAATISAAVWSCPMQEHGRRLRPDVFSRVQPYSAPEIKLERARSLFDQVDR